MAISSASVIGAQDTGTSGLKNTANLLQQFAAQKQQQSQFDQNMAMLKKEKEDNDLAIKNKALALQEEYKINSAKSQFELLNAPDQKIKTWASPSASKSRYQSGVYAGLIPPELSYEEYQVSVAPSEAEMTSFVAGGQKMLELNAKIAKDKADILNTQAGIQLQSEAQAQTVKNEDATLKYKYDALGFDLAKSKIRDPNMATDHRATMDAIVEEINAIDSMDLKPEEKAKKRLSLSPRVVEYNTLASLYGTDKLKLEKNEDKTKVFGPFNNYFDYTIGFEGKIKPLPRGGQEEQVATTPNTEVAEPIVGRDPTGTEYTQADIDSLKTILATGSSKQKADAQLKLNSIK